MLVGLKEIITEGRKRGIAVGNFNTPNLECLLAVLDAAEELDVPIIIHIDCVNYLDYYPELWNWFDPNIAGYDPNNAANVERYDWGEGHEVMLGWRNWGSQHRVKPMVNLASSEFRQLNRDIMPEMYEIISDWYAGLSNNKKYLLGGVVMGWELSTYAQNYYYENGNSYYSQDPANDPTGTETSGSVEKADGYYASIPLGYAAAETLGLQPEKGQLKMSTIDAICSDYMEFLIDMALMEGIPADRIITHASELPQTVNNGGGHSGSASISEHKVEGVMPGWSLYWDLAYEDTFIDLADGGPWAAIELRSWNLSYEFLDTLLNYRNCQIINIYNWESIEDDPNTIDALKKVLKGAC
jgi:hypothetical protein